MSDSAQKKYVISVGSNISTAKEMVENGLRRLKTLLSDSHCSSIYSTPSVSRGDDSTYFNAVIAGVSRLSLVDLSHKCKKLELEMGRCHDSACKDVAVDIDIVVADGEIVRPKDFNRDYFHIGFNQLCKGNSMVGRED